jgi:hypothetical protein
VTREHLRLTSIKAMICAFLKECRRLLRSNW